MPAITDYPTLTTAINDLTEGGYAAGDTDRFIGLAEADFRLYFGPHYARETANLTLAFTSGSATIPTGFIRVLSLLHTTYGGLTEASIGVVREARIAAPAIPQRFAVTGSTIELDATYTGNLVLDYEASLTGLSGSNTTNWLITNAPQAYLQLCVHYAKAFDEDPSAPVYKAEAMRTLNDLSIQSTVAKSGRARVHLPGSTP